MVGIIISSVVVPAVVLVVKPALKLVVKTEVKPDVAVVEDPMTDKVKLGLELVVGKDVEDVVYITSVLSCIFIHKAQQRAIQE